MCHRIWDSSDPWPACQDFSRAGRAVVLVLAERVLLTKMSILICARMGSWSHRHAAHDASWTSRRNDPLGLIGDFSRLISRKSAHRGRTERLRFFDVVGNQDDAIARFVVTDLELSDAKLSIRTQIELRLGLREARPRRHSLEAGRAVVRAHGQARRPASSPSTSTVVSDPEEMRSRNRRCPGSPSASTFAHRTSMGAISRPSDSDTAISCSSRVVYYRLRNRWQSIHSRSA